MPLGSLPVARIQFELYGQFEAWNTFPPATPCPRRFPSALSNTGSNQGFLISVSCPASERREDCALEGRDHGGGTLAKSVHFLGGEGGGRIWKTLGAGDRSGSLWVPRLSAETLQGFACGHGEAELWTSPREPNLSREGGPRNQCPKNRVNALGLTVWTPPSPALLGAGWGRELVPDVSMGA